MDTTPLVSQQAQPALTSSAQQLPKNPMLPQHPLGAYTDAQFEAQDAILRAQVAKQYADILRQLGYVDPKTGQFIPGDVEQQAMKTRSELGRSKDLATEEQTYISQRNGTLFSGV